MIQDIIRMFGGLSQFSDVLGVPKQTICGWKRNNRIPVWRMGAIRNAAADLNIQLPPEFDQSNKSTKGKEDA